MFASKIFYLNAAVHLLFFIFLILFVSHYQFSFTQPQVFSYKLFSNGNVTTSTVGNSIDTNLQNVTNGDLYFRTSNSAFTEVFRFGMVIFALLGVIFRAYEIVKTNLCIRKDNKEASFGKRIKIYIYENMKMLDRYIDFLLFSISIVIGITSLIGSYGRWTHTVGCLLIICSVFQCISLLTHAPLIGQQCRMLMVIIKKICFLFPILAFMLVTFAVLFYTLCQNRDQFSHIGLSIAKIMAMMVGELDYGNLFFNEKQEHNFEIVSFFIFITFMLVMTVAMMNLLISVAVGDIAEIRNQEDQLSFLSKVELILQYALIFAGMGIINDRYLKEFKHWGKYAVNQSKFKHLEVIYADISNKKSTVENRDSTVGGNYNFSYIETEKSEEIHYVQPTYI